MSEDYWRGEFLRLRSASEADERDEVTTKDGLLYRRGKVITSKTK